MRANSAEAVEKPPRPTVLAEPFPGTVAQGLALVFAKEMNELILGQKQMPTQIRVLGVRGGESNSLRFSRRYRFAAPHPEHFGWGGGNATCLDKAR